MALYQNSVLKKYLKQQDSEAVAKAFKKFSKYFHDPKIQENIRSSKEEEYQGIFLTELFSKILGYTMKPNANFNLVAEYKNEKNSRKADGAILKDNEALGVIELKGTNTKDLEKVRQQAFDYKANQTGCVYVITSNFEKIRFYINNAVEFEEFDLFNLNQERFELLYLCLAQENLLNNVPLKIKEASVQEEEAITKQFYKDYSTFKRELFRGLVKLNMKNEVFRAELNIEDAERANKNIKHNLFKKSQKLIDRFLFIFFAEDRGLLPPNSTVKILEQWDKLKELDEVVPLYSRYKKYFNYLDTGRKGTDKTAEIFAYNGGLFKPDPVLDSLIISDELLAKHTNALQAYDFESQVDVNILGHIFENSLNEIESVNAEIEGGDFDKQTSKRKKDGVFYTPKYITKYIVDNTVGKLSNEKKAELKIVEEEYRPKRQKETKKKLLAAIETYREWLLQLTILDPACGSGAFLNQALDFLIKEHQYIDVLQTNLLGGGFVFPNIENTVLENNIFGVDLNEESVEIAKLSLWLRTAQPRRKLNNLSSNIKCGNSIIDSKSLAGDKAFKWSDEFSEIFKKGGFDVVIGNPPYGAHLTKLEKEFLYSKYTTLEYQIDTYTVFIEFATSILRANGKLGYIVPSTWLTMFYFKDLRSFLIKETKLEELLLFRYQVFSDVTAETSIVLFSKKENTSNFNVNINYFDRSDEVESKRFKKIGSTTLSENCGLGFNLLFDESKMGVIKKIQKESTELEILATVWSGMVPYEVGKGTPKQSREDLKARIYDGEFKKDESYLNYLVGGDIIKYGINPNPKNWIKFGDNLAASRKKFNFFQRKIVVRQTGDSLICSLDNKGFINLKSVHNIITKEDFSLEVLIALLNSKLMGFYYEYLVPEKGRTFAEVKGVNLKRLPIITSLKESVVENVEALVSSCQEANYSLIEQQNRFLNYLSNSFDIKKHSRKMSKWYNLETREFIKELNKSIKKAGGDKLTKMDEMEWMDVFETKKAEAQTLKTEIDKTDAEIDAMVYELYGLSKEEIEIVEQS